MYLNEKIEVIIEKDTLNRVVFEFMLINSTLVLSTYLVQLRATTRHKFKTIKRYSRLNNPRANTINVNDINIPELVEKQALEKLFELLKSTITVGK